MTTDTGFNTTASNAPQPINANNAAAGELSHTEVSPVQDSNQTALKSDNLLNNPNTLVLNSILDDKDITWQVHNCKIIDKTVTQDQPLPFIYHYDTLPEDIRKQNPLKGDLLKQFQTLMSAKQATQLLGVDPDLVPSPWMVKVTGTLVMFSERLQIALRLKFTNTAKTHDPVYTTTAEKAVQTSMEDWHFYGDVFVLNKDDKPLIMTIDSDWIEIPQLAEYQVLPGEYGLAALALLEESKSFITPLEDAIKQRLL